MANVIKLRKGLDINLKGKASKDVVHTRQSLTLAAQHPWKPYPSG